MNFTFRRMNTEIHCNADTHAWTPPRDRFRIRPHRPASIRCSSTVPTPTWRESTDPTIQRRPSPVRSVRSSRTKNRRLCETSTKNSRVCEGATNRSRTHSKTPRFPSNSPPITKAATRTASRNVASTSRQRKPRVPTTEEYLRLVSGNIKDPNNLITL